MRRLIWFVALVICFTGGCARYVCYRADTKAPRGMVNVTVVPLTSLRQPQDFKTLDDYEVTRPVLILEPSLLGYSVEASVANELPLRMVFQLTIERDGAVSSAKLLSGSPASMLLSTIATATVQSWRFQPSLRKNGQPTKVAYNVAAELKRLD